MLQRQSYAPYALYGHHGRSVTSNDWLDRYLSNSGTRILSAQHVSAAILLFPLVADQAGVEAKKIARRVVRSHSSPRHDSKREKGFHTWPHGGSLLPKNCLWRSVAEGFLDLFYAPVRQEIVCKEIVESSSLKQCFNHLSRNQFSPVPGNKFRPKGVEKPNPDVGENLVAATALSLYLQLIEPDITTLKAICYTVGCKLGQIGSTFRRR